MLSSCIALSTVLSLHVRGELTPSLSDINALWHLDSSTNFSGRWPDVGYRLLGNEAVDHVLLDSKPDAFSSAGQIFVDTSSCLSDPYRPLHVEVWSAIAVPLSQLHVLLLRPHDGGSFEVVAVTESISRQDLDKIPHSPTQWHTLPDRWLSLPGTTAVAFGLSRAFTGEGRDGDCFGLYHAASGDGVIASREGGAHAGHVRLATPSAAVIPGARFIFGQPTMLSLAVAWHVVVPHVVLQALPRQYRLRLLRETLRAGGLGLSSVSLRTNLLDVFGSEEWAGALVIEIGSCSGHLTAVLSALFGMVFAVELFLGSIESAQEDYLHELKNIVFLNHDTGDPYSLSALAGNHIQVAYIDGAHGTMHVARDTFGVLHDIPCCVKVVIYHDYCDDEVYRAVQIFVRAGVLYLRRGIGVEPADFAWCRGERPEGAIFNVIRGRDLRTRLNNVRFELQGLVGGHDVQRVQHKLNGTRWTLMHTHSYPYAFLTLHLAPRRATLRFLFHTPGCSPYRADRGVDFGLVHILGWEPGQVSSRWAAAALIAEVKAPLRSSLPAAARLVFEAELTGFSLTVLEPGAVECLAPEVIAVRFGAFQPFLKQMRLRSSLDLHA